MGRRGRLLAGAFALVVLAAACEAAPGDFTGDRKADAVSITFPSAGTQVWSIAGQGTPIATLSPGNGFEPVAGDFDGDLEWEPAAVSGTTWISGALADPIEFDPTGMPAGPAAAPHDDDPPETLLPVPGDYDGTGKTVPAYYDQVDGSWWIMGHSGSVRFGRPPVADGTLDYDVPVPADYDGDHKTDIAVFRPSDGSFHYLSSQTGQEVTIPSPAPTGYPAVLPVPADYDNVGHAEAAVTDLLGQKWFVAGHPDPVATFDVSASDDLSVPAPADFDGDGKADPALFDTRSGAYWIAGQAKPPQVGQAGRLNETPLLPNAVLVNIVRLTLWEACRQDPTHVYPGTC